MANLRLPSASPVAYNLSMNETRAKTKPDEAPLRRGWTTGACATAATHAALAALITGEFPDPVSITLPKGQKPSFALAFESLGDGYASAGIVKDAGDDPDVTHGATIIATVRSLPPGSGIAFAAGEGVGKVTLAGLPVAVGEPAINPVPRKMMTEVVEKMCAEAGLPADVEITITVPGGEVLAEKTWNPRLGIVGGISILGTTGIVQPFSCSAWIHSIHRGIDVARAAGLTHVLGATGSTSEAAAQAIYDLPEIALLDMGDFAGGLLKYLRTHPIDRLTIAGGFAKLTKLAQGAMDLHSSRSQVDMDFLAGLVPDDRNSPELLQQIQNANTALEVLEITRKSDIDLAPIIAEKAGQAAMETLRGAAVSVDILVTDREGNILARQLLEPLSFSAATREAADLAERLAARGDWHVIFSLAGRTRSPDLPAGETRIGGFGGADGLATFLATEGIDILIDATHPFATTISRNATEAADRTDTKLLRLERGSWSRESDDIWTGVSSEEEACAAIPPGARVFLALGRQYVDTFAKRSDVHFVLRMVDQPDKPLPFADCDLLIGRPSPDVDAEGAMLQDRRITLIVCRNSGGRASYAKIAAARQLSIPVIMIERPQAPEGLAFSTVDALMAAMG